MFQMKEAKGSLYSTAVIGNPLKEKICSIFIQCEHTPHHREFSYTTVMEKYRSMHPVS